MSFSLKQGVKITDPATQNQASNHLAISSRSKNMAQTPSQCFLAKSPLPDDSHPLKGRTLFQAQQLLTKILSKYNTPNYANPSLRHWFDQDLCHAGRPGILHDYNYSFEQDEACLRKCSDALIGIAFDGLLESDRVRWAMTRETDEEWKRYQHKGAMITNRPKLSTQTPADQRVHIIV
jgi:hypothetical protein